MEEKRNIVSKIVSIIFYIVVIIIIAKLYGVYKYYYFNDFTKGEYFMGNSSFTRDKEVKYSKFSSYKIQSIDYNDAIFYKEVEVKPNTPYKVTCMIKTENVEQKVKNTDAGAMICIVENSEISKNITGTQDWQKVELMFNSKARTTVKIGFRLGGNDGYAKGTAWFSDFKIEQGTAGSSSEWKIGFFIFKNIDVTIDNEQYKFQTTTNDVDRIKEDIYRFKTSCKELSNYLMSVKEEIYEIDEPIRTITYSDEHEYYIDANDIKDTLEKMIDINEYDQIFVITKMGNEDKEIPVKNWVGLGGMKIYDAGYSNIRLPSNSKNLIYTYNGRTNTFPEEVLVHEFLHTLERNSQEYGYEVPELHAHEKYGYHEESVITLKNWYKDYMRCSVLDKNTRKYVGIHPDVYKLKPAHKENFEYTLDVDFIKEPRKCI